MRINPIKHRQPCRIQARALRKETRFALPGTTRLLTLSAMFALVTQGAMAGTATWIASGTGSWSNSPNWQTGNVPTNAEDAWIDNGGTAIVDLADAQAYVVYAGGFNAGNFQINGGRTLQSIAGILADGQGSSGTATVSGTWVNTGNFFVGNDGAGTLDIKSGGYLSNVTATIGNGASGSGTVTVNGTWMNTGSLYVGYRGMGALDIQSGGYVSDATGCLGYDTGAVGTATVSGTWVNTGDLFVGLSGTGTLDIQSGGYVSDATGYLGYNTGAVGTATVSGTWVNTSNLLVGLSGTGTLDIQSGGYVSDAAGYLGYNTGAVGTATVSGTWVNTGDLYVGLFGTGTLDIKSGGYVSGYMGTIGSAAGSSGSATVSGTWVNTGNLFVGNSGTGTLDIKSGGYVKDSTALISVWNNGNGAATVSGTWVNTDDLCVGLFGTGTLDIQSGGYVSDATGYLGYNTGAVGTATVSGTWVNTSALYVGADGTGNLDIKSGGYVSSPYIALGSGTITLSGSAGNRAVLSIVQIASGTNGVLTVDGGILKASGNSNYFLYDFAPGNLQFQSGGGFIDSNGYYIAASPQIQGAGGLTKQGDGTLTLSASNSYSGGTTIEKGTLLASNANALGSGAVYLKSGGMLKSVVQLKLSSFTWDAGGKVGLTLSGGTLAISGDFTKGGGSGSYQFDLYDLDNVDLTQSFTLATFGANDGFDVSDFNATDYNGLSAKFTLSGTSLTVTYGGDGLITGPILQNSAPVNTSTNAKFLVTGSNQTGGPDESNTVQSLYFQDGGSLLVHNTLTVTSGSFVATSGTGILAGGTVVTDGDFQKLGAGTLITDSTIQVGGAAAVKEGGLVINGQFEAVNGLTVFENTILGGSGVITGNVINHGILSPGNSPGTLTVIGDHTQASDSVFLLEVAGKSNFDRLVVSDVLNLAGALEVVPYDGYLFQYGDKFTFLKAGKINGAFDSVLLPEGFRYPPPLEVRQADPAACARELYSLCADAEPEIGRQGARPVHRSQRRRPGNRQHRARRVEGQRIWQSLRADCSNFLRDAHQYHDRTKQRAGADAPAAIRRSPPWLPWLQPNRVERPRRCRKQRQNLSR